MKSRVPFLLIVLFCFIQNSNAQYNEKGTVRIAVGASIGVHGTRYEQQFSFGGMVFEETTTDGAATITFPIQVGYGLSRSFGLGLLLEPGSYLDSNATRGNSLFLYGLEPRFHVVNKDRFALMLGLQLGGGALNIAEQGPSINEAKFGGAMFGLNTGVAFGFSDHLGLQLQLRYLATRLTLGEYSESGTVVPLTNFEATLRTGGVTLRASVAYKF